MGWADEHTAPGTDQPEQLVVWQLLRQVRSCLAMGSPLGAAILTAAATDVLEGGPCAALLVPHARPGRGDAAALRFLAALHRLALQRRAPQLALHLPTTGGTADLAGVGRVVVETVAAHADDLPALVALPCQTNEVGRSAALLVGHLHVAGLTGLPLRLREVGASGGLGLLVDRYAVSVPTADGGTRRLGPADAEVVLDGLVTTPLPGDPTAMPRVVDRRGCDLRPVDVATADGRLRLSASVWPDMVERFERLGAALRTAAADPPVVDEASAAGWVAEQLAESAPGTATVVFHSVVEEYLPDDERAALHATVEAAGARATSDAPVAHVRMEPATDVRAAVVDVRVWPHAPERRRLATCGAHGTDTAVLPSAR